MTKNIDFLTYDYPEEQEKIRQTLEDLMKAVEERDVDRVESFHLYGPKFTRIDDGKRSDSDQCREIERQLLVSADKIKASISDLKIDVFDKVAIVTDVADFESQVGSNSVSLKAMGTIVFVKVGDEWKITYETLSPITSS